MSKINLIILLSTQQLSATHIFLAYRIPSWFQSQAVRLRQQAGPLWCTGVSFDRSKSSWLLYFCFQWLVYAQAREKF